MAKPLYNPNVRSTDPDDYQHLAVAVAAMRKTFPDGSSTSMHSHRRHQLLYAVTGTMRIRTASHTWIVPPARALFMPSRMDHDVTACGTAEMCTLYIERHAFLDARATPLVINVSGLLRELIVALLSEPADYDPEGRGGMLADLILYEIRRGREIPLSIPMPRDSRLLRVCTFLLDNPADESTVDKLAERAGASPRTLARLFHQELGLSLSAWRQQVRFHHALEALAQNKPISQIATSCGYRSASAFTAAFRNAFGVPPSQMSSVIQGSSEPDQIS